MSGLQKFKGTDISPKTAVTAILIFIIVLSGVVAAVVKSHSGGSSEPESSKIDERPSMSVDVEENKTTTSKQAVKNIALAGQPIPAWKTIADRNIFQPIAGYSAGKAEPAKVSAGPRMKPLIPPMPLGVLPFNGGGMGFGGMRRDRVDSKSIAYTGIVETPEGRLALLENTSTMQTKYAAVGDEVFGMRVVDFNPRSATLDSGGETVRLSIGENKSAAQPAAGQPNPAGQQPPNAQAAGQTGQQDGSASGRAGRRFGRIHNGSNADNGGGAGAPGGGAGAPSNSQ